MSTNNGSLKISYPYARLKGLSELMAFIREPDWKPSRIDKALLKKLAISKGKEYEAIRALTFLGVIDQNNIPTGVFDELKSDYQVVLKRIVSEKYSEIFSLIPPRMINQQRLVNFFETTTDTAEYQAKLFVWLCNEASIDLPNMEKRIHRARFDKKKENTPTK